MRGSLPCFRGFLLAASVLGVLAFPWFAQAGVINVSYIGGDGWSIGDHQSTATASMVHGPGTPPIGIGSLQLTTGPGSGSQGGFIELGTTAYNGLTLSQINSMSFDTYITSRMAGTSVAPTIHIYLNDPSRSTGRSFVNLIYEPTYSSNNGDPTMIGQWQHWDAFNGPWWTTNHDFLQFGGGSSTYPNLGTWAGLLGPNAQITGISISAGQHSSGSPWQGFQGNADNFQIGTTSGTTTFNFDPPVPEPTSLMVWGTLALAGLTLRRVRRTRTA